MLKRHRSSVESTEFMLAQLTAAIYNTGFKSPEKHVNAVDYMPSQWAKKANAKAAPKRIRMTKKRRQSIFEGLRATLAQVATVVK